MIEKDLTEVEILRLRDIIRGAEHIDRDHPVPPSDIWEAIEANLHTEALATVSSGRGRTFVKLLAAACALAVAGFAAIGFFFSAETETVVISRTVISNDGMPVVSPASGTATLISVDGMLELQLDVEQLATDEGFYELWIAEADASTVRSLGEVSGDGRFVLPADFDRIEYPAVAISLEQFDGNDEFSGNAVLFGVFP